MRWQHPENEGRGSQSECSLEFVRQSGNERGEGIGIQITQRKKQRFFDIQNFVNHFPGFLQMFGNGMCVDLRTAGCNGLFCHGAVYKSEDIPRCGFKWCAKLLIPNFKIAVVQHRAIRASHRHTIDPVQGIKNMTAFFVVCTAEPERSPCANAVRIKIDFFPEGCAGGGVITKSDIPSIAKKMDVAWSGKRKSSTGTM